MGYRGLLCPTPPRGGSEIDLGGGSGACPLPPGGAPTPSGSEIRSAHAPPGEGAAREVTSGRKVISLGFLVGGLGAPGVKTRAGGAKSIWKVV